MYASSLGVGLILTVLSGAAANVPGLSAVGVLFAPRMLAGGISFPQGPQSDWPKAYLVVATLMSAFFYSWPVLGLWLFIDRVWSR
jgi:hypothetical protein